MAGPTKKSKKVAQPESDNESMSAESESESYNGQQEIQATFEGRNPESHDFHGIKQLLNQLFLKAHIDLSQLSDMIIGQNGIGSVLKQGLADSDDEEDEDMVDSSDVFGVTTVINLTSHKETPCIQQFYALLDELSQKHANNLHEEIKSLLDSGNKLGFLINERFVNIPAKISTVMFNALCSEIDRMMKKDSSYNFDYYVLISKTCHVKGTNEVIFSNDEEIVFDKAADIGFEFSVEKEADTGLGGKWSSEDKQVIPHRKVLIFKANKFKDILNEISALVQ